MNFKNFITSILVSTMLVGSQATISGAMEYSSKCVAESKSEKKGIVNTILKWVPASLGVYDSSVNVYHFMYGTGNAFCYSIFCGRDGTLRCANSNKFTFEHIATLLFDAGLIYYSFLL